MKDVINERYADNIVNQPQSKIDIKAKKIGERPQKNKPTTSNRSQSRNKHN
jgi:hypothetical protein